MNLKDTQVEIKIIGVIDITFSEEKKRYLTQPNVFWLPVLRV
jgi:hypothetical protein